MCYYVLLEQPPTDMSSGCSFGLLRQCRTTQRLELTNAGRGRTSSGFTFLTMSRDGEVVIISNLGCTQGQRGRDHEKRIRIDVGRQGREPQSPSRSKSSIQPKRSRGLKAEVLYMEPVERAGRLKRAVDLHSHGQSQRDIEQRTERSNTLSFIINL